MAVAIRLRREGNRNSPFYKIVVSDQRSPRDGKFIEIIGSYDPKKEGENFILKLDRADYWVGVGARPSQTVGSIINKARKKDRSGRLSSLSHGGVPALRHRRARGVSRGAGHSKDRVLRAHHLPPRHAQDGPPPRHRQRRTHHSGSPYAPERLRRKTRPPRPPRNHRGKKRGPKI